MKSRLLKWYEEMTVEKQREIMNKILKIIEKRLYKMDKLGQEPAFPVIDVSDGMSKRFYAACAAMQGIVSNNNLFEDCMKDAKQMNRSTEREIAIFAYSLVDELLKRENE
jgi:hypothetical protein